MTMWLGTPVVFAGAAALIFALMYLLMPDLSSTGWAALFIAAAAFAVCMLYHFLMRKKMYHTYEADIHKDQVIIYKDGKEINLGQAVYAVMSESETDGYRKAVLYIMGKTKRVLLTAYSKKIFYGLGCKEDVYQMELAYFELKKYLPDMHQDAPQKKMKKGKKK